jgi:hypothetical protein
MASSALKPKKAFRPAEFQEMIILSGPAQIAAVAELASICSYRPWAGCVSSNIVSAPLVPVCFFRSVKNNLLLLIIYADSAAKYPPNATERWQNASARQPHPVAQHVYRDAFNLFGGAFCHQQKPQRALFLCDEVDRLEFVHVAHGDIHVGAQRCAKRLDLFGQFFENDSNLKHHDHCLVDRGQPFEEAAPRVSPAPDGGGWSASVAMVTISLTDSTISPQAWPPSWVTMIAWRGVWPRSAGQPSRAARSITGSTVPRRLTTPAT